MPAGWPRGWTAEQVAYRDRLARHIVRKRRAGEAYPIARDGTVLRGHPYALATSLVRQRIERGEELR